MDWQLHLKTLSRNLLSNLDGDFLEILREEGIRDYLGYPPATIAEIELAQTKLGFELPDSLKNFFLASNGLHSADAFPVGIANILPVTELYLLSTCNSRDLDLHEQYVTEHFGERLAATTTTLENCVVIIDLDGNEVGFVIRTKDLDDWPLVTYDPDGGDFESYSGFIDLMSSGLNY